MALPFGTREILNSIPFFKKGGKILDIGLGDGDASEAFLDRGLDVYATGIDIESYKLKEAIKSKIHLEESFVTKLNFPDNFFDYIWASHILEHEINPGLAFQEIRRVLKNGGKLIVCLPPYKSKIVGGHVNTGYTIGQLMYQLILNKFNINKGSFIKYGYNICGIVEKDDSIVLPTLRYDSGDIDQLANLFPMNVQQGFEGDLKNINWSFPLPKEYSLISKIHNILYRTYKKITKIWK